MASGLLERMRHNPLDGVDVAALDIKRFDSQNWEAAMTERVPWR